MNSQDDSIPMGPEDPDMPGRKLLKDEEDSKEKDPKTSKPNNQPVTNNLAKEDNQEK